MQRKQALGRLFLQFFRRDAWQVDLAHSSSALPSADCSGGDEASEILSRYLAISIGCEAEDFASASARVEFVDAGAASRRSSGAGIRRARSRDAGSLILSTAPSVIIICVMI